MKFFTNRIVTKQISLEEAVKNAQNKQQVRSIDEILSDIKQQKIATSNTKAVKTASTEISEEVQPKVQVNVASVKTQKTTKSANVILKVANKIDFRNWSSEQLNTAWSQHGTFEKCLQNVDGLTSSPKTYCGLLREAANQFGVKTASKKDTKQIEAGKSSEFVKISKLTTKDKKDLKAYFLEIYGEEYVNALVAD